MESSLLLNNCNLCITTAFRVHLVESGNTIANNKTRHVLAQGMNSSGNVVALI